VETEKRGNEPRKDDSFFHLRKEPPPQKGGEKRNFFQKSRETFCRKIFPSKRRGEPFFFVGVARILGKGSMSTERED